MPDIDPAAYGLRGSGEGVQQLVGDIRKQLLQDIRQEVLQDIRLEMLQDIRQNMLDDIREGVAQESRASVHEQMYREIDARNRAEYEAQLEARVQALFEQLVLSRRRQFGRSMETSAAQYRLFDEADSLAEDSTEADDVAVLPEAKPQATSPKVVKPRGKRQPLPAELPRVEFVHELPEGERVCQCCGTTMVEIGEDVREELDIIPMQVRVLRHVRKRYACSRGDSTPRTAPAPLQVLPRTNASNDLLAMLLTTKYADALPLARFEHVLARSGVTVPRQTLARWVIGASKALQPIHNLLRDHLLASPVIHMDETTVQVLREPARKTGSPAYMWVQKGGPPSREVVIFDYDPSRSGQVPLRLLEGWRGYLMTDGYEGYNAVGKTEGVEHLVCWVHARRQFVNAPRAVKGKRGRADEAVDMIGQLYGIERELGNAADQARLQARQTRSREVLEKLRTWLDETRPLVTPKSELGKALRYLDHYWDRLVRYTERGDLPMDNNRVENAIRPFVVGRKNWLFNDTSAGAHASAVVYSLIETARANGREPYTWLRHVLRKLPHAGTVDDYEALLPWNLSLEVLALETVGAE